MEGTANIVSTRVNVAVPHALTSSSLKLKPARFALESLPQYLQDNIAGHTTTMLNLFDDVKKKEVGISKFNET